MWNLVRRAFSARSGESLPQDKVSRVIKSLKEDLNVKAIKYPIFSNYKNDLIEILCEIGGCFFEGNTGEILSKYQALFQQVASCVDSTEGALQEEIVRFKLRITSELGPMIITQSPNGDQRRDDSSVNGRNSDDDSSSQGRYSDTVNLDDIPEPVSNVASTTVGSAANNDGRGSASSIEDAQIVRGQSTLVSLGARSSEDQEVGAIHSPNMSLTNLQVRSTAPDASAKIGSVTLALISSGVTGMLAYGLVNTALQQDITNISQVSLNQWELVVITFVALCITLAAIRQAFDDCTAPSVQSTRAPGV